MVKLSKNQMIVLGIILFLIIFASVFSCGVIPYTKAPNYSSFEPFETIDAKSSLIPETKNDESILIPKPQLTTSKSVESQHEEKTKEGFVGYAPFSINDNLQTIDIFAKLPSNPNCRDTGYTKNGGFVCIDENVKQLIMNRGVNYGQ